LVGPKAPILKNKELLQELVDDLDKQTSPGVSGWSTQLIQICFGHEGDDETEPFRDFLFLYFKSIVVGTAPGQSMMCAARLIPINKNQFVVGFIGPLQIRPITVGEMFYRLGMRFALQELNSRRYMRAHQFGCGSKGGVEPMLEKMQQLVDESTHEKRWNALLFDIRNAHNRVNRVFMADAIRDKAPDLYSMAKWAYNTRTPLVVSSGGKLVIIASSDGVRQGGPEASDFFSIPFGVLLQEMEEELCENGDVVMSFADDLAVSTLNDDLKPPIVDFFEANKGRTGLELNIPKCECFELMAVKQGVIAMPWLGSMIGTVEHRRAFLVAKIAEVDQDIEKLKHLPRHHAAILLRMSMSNKLRHLLRSMDLRDLGPEVQSIDESIYSMVDHLRGLPVGEDRGPLAVAITNWPMRLGGFGILGHGATLVCAAEASTEASIRLLSEKNLITSQSMSDLAELLSNEGVPDADNRYLQFGPLPAPHEEPPGPFVKQGARVEAKLKAENATWFSNLTHEQQLVYMDNAESLKWLNALPNGKWRSLNDKQIQACLNILMLRPRDEGPICPHCAQLNSLAHYELCPANNRVAAMTLYRHNCNRNCIATTGNKIQGQVLTIEPLFRDELPQRIPQPGNNAAHVPLQPPVPPPPPQPPQPAINAAQAQPRHNPQLENNAMRADVKVRMQGGVMEHPYCGLLDIASKSVPARHT